MIILYSDTYDTILESLTIHLLNKTIIVVTELGCILEMKFKFSHMNIEEIREYCLAKPLPGTIIRSLSLFDIL